MSSNTWKMMVAVMFLFLAVLVLVLVSIPTGHMYVVACDVGQGDAILITKGVNQILIDGGPRRESVVDCLEDHIPFWDRTIEIVVLTHPQEDHYGGLIEVFDNYNVGYLLANKVDNSTSGYRLLKEKVGGSETIVINPKVGQQYRLGLIYLDVLNAENVSLIDIDSGSRPGMTSERSGMTAGAGYAGQGVLGAYDTKADLNKFSIVIKLKYGEFDALFTGDIGPGESEIVADRLKGKLDYLKVPHHGSKNGVSESLIEKSKPVLAVISAGAKNRYGHPHKEIVDLLQKYNVSTYLTSEIGDVVVKTDGEKYWINE